MSSMSQVMCQAACLAVSERPGIVYIVSLRYLILCGCRLRCLVFCVCLPRNLELPSKKVIWELPSKANIGWRGVESSGRG